MNLLHHLSRLSRRGAEFVLAFGVAWIAVHQLPSDREALAQKAPRKAAKAKAEDPCANFAFEQMPVNDEAGKQSAREVRVVALQSGALGGANEQIFEQYYSQYQLPLFTQCRELNNLTRFRKVLREDFKSARGPVRAKLTGVCLSVGQQIAAGNYHPASRYNAMLMIADLNATEGDDAAKAPAVPLPEALPVLLQALEDPKQHDVVKCAALVGIDRHARSGNVQAVKPRITAALVALLNEKTPPDGRTSQGHDWMRSQAADILGTLRDVGPRNEVVAALEQVVADSSAAASLRVRAARALGNLDYSAAKQLNPSELAARIADLAVSSYNQEKTQKDRVGQYPNRRLLKVYFQSAYTGLVGAGGTDNKQNLLALAKASGEPHSAFVTGLVGELAPVTNHEIFDTEVIKDVELNKQFIDLRSKASKLESYLKANRPKAAKPAPAAATAEGGKQDAPPAAAQPGAQPAPATPAAAPPAGKQ